MKSLNPVTGSLNPQDRTGSSIRPAKAPRLVAGLARSHNKAQKALQSGPGIRIHKAGGNTLLITEAGGAGGNSGELVSVVGSDGKLNKVPKHADWATPTTYPTVLKIVDGTKSILLDSTGITMTDTGTGFSFTVAFASLTKNVALRVDGVCDSGTAKSMLHLGSAPYT